MDMPRNAFKHAIAKGQLQIGLWCSLCSPVAIEVVSHSGYDWLLLDTEHSPNDVHRHPRRSCRRRRPAPRRASCGRRGTTWC